MATDRYQSLLSEKGGKGFPYLAFMDAEGSVVAKHQGQRSIEAFQESGKKAQSFLDLKAKSEKGDAAAQFAYLVAQIDLGQLKKADAENRVSELKNLTKEQKARLDGMLINLEALEIAVTVTRDKATQVEAGRKFAEMKKAGRIPSGDSELGPFWSHILAYAEDQKDAGLFEEGLNALKAKFGNSARSKKFLEEKEAILKKLKEGK